MSHTERFPNYTVGADAYDAIPEVCSPFGETAVIIGGKRALAAAQDEIHKVCAEAGIAVSGTLWYGGEASLENIAMLMEDSRVQVADMVFAVGGGKAIDTCKVVAQRMEKPFFTFPTIASTCASCTSLGILYYPSGELREYSFSKVPAVHIFINTRIIAQAPREYLWAGIGDTLAKYYECTVSGRGDELSHSNAFGSAISVMCGPPLVKYGVGALEACERGEPSYELEQAVLDIIVSTGFVSNLVVIDYNTGLAHAIYNGLTVLPQMERHLHGEAVAYGVLVLLICDNQMEELARIYDFNRRMGLPTCLADLDVTVEEIGPAVDKASGCMDIRHWPYPVTRERIWESVQKLEAYHSGRLSASRAM